MGMSSIEAEAFYAMTNSAPFESAKWFGTGTMGLWVNLDRALDRDMPENRSANLAYQDVSSLTLADASINGTRLYSDVPVRTALLEIGRPAGRERVCQYV